MALRRFALVDGIHETQGGKLLGPSLLCTDDPFQFYRLTFESKTKTLGTYAIFFQDATGKDLVADDYASVRASEKWEANEVCFRGREGGVRFRIGFQGTDPVSIKNLAVLAISAADVRAWSDRLYATLPPVAFTVPAATGALIPKALAKMRIGTPLRVVMLGDSIVNDTFNSHWDTLAGRVFPKAALQVLASVIGGGSCRHYQKDESFQKHVTDLQPDLLMIGGISHGSDLKALRTVIFKTRAAIPGCEILLLSGPGGKDFRAPVGSAPGTVLSPSAAVVDPFAAQQEALAKELQVEYWDMATPWSHYLATSAKPFEWFNRDYIHADNRGRQVFARILDVYFTRCAAGSAAASNRGP